MVRSYRYRLAPTQAQQRILKTWLALTRALYNAALQQRREAWDRQRRGLSCYAQMGELPALRLECPEFAGVPVMVLRGALVRLERAFHGFFRRCKQGGRPGYPRFRGAHRWDTLMIEDLGGRVPICGGGKRVQVPLLGKVKFRQHRPLEGVPKAMRLTRDAGGRWFVTFACVEVPRKALPPSSIDVGVDLGLAHFAVTSDGEVFENPRPLEAAQRALARAQRRVARRKRGSQRRRAAVLLLARRYEHVANVRREGHIKVARELVATYGVICVEDLNIRGMATGRLARSVHDAGWGSFLHWLRVKAEEAGREVVGVDPRGTSQGCSGCGALVPKSLATRVHRCPSCGLVLDRDLNAARNIVWLGRSQRGAAPRSGGRPGSAKAES
ncbi:MAG: transposase [bacterium]